MDVATPVGSVSKSGVGVAVTVVVRSALGVNVEKLVGVTTCMVEPACGFGVDVAGIIVDVEVGAGRVGSGVSVGAGVSV